ncbi:MAG: peptidase [Pirellulales bacterium]|nr:peptidase [Pirellulales bacterium]
MRQFGRGCFPVWASVAACAVAWGLFAGAVSAAEIVLQDGRTLKGKPVEVSGLAELPQAPGPDGVGPVRSIVMLDDDLRRTFVSQRLVQDVRQDDPGQVVEKFDIWQRVPRAGRAVKSVGPVLRITPFDEFGRRIFSFNTVEGPVDVRQGITLLTPQWAKVEGESHLWDMRIATSSIPPETLHKILLKQINPNDVEHRKKIARFYLQAERYRDAREALEGIVGSFPDKPDLQQELAPLIRALRQMETQRLLSLLKLRRDAGQHHTVLRLLKAFPSENVAGEILQQVREMVQEYEVAQARGRQVLQQLDLVVAEIKDTPLRARIKPIRDEIEAELNINTLGRMTSFLQHCDNANLQPEEKAAIAVSGWLLGSDAATENLPVALSVYRVRDLARRYLREPIKLNRAQIFGQMVSEEGASPQRVAGLLAHMKPAVEPPEPVSPERPAFFRLEVPGLPKEPPVEYLVQLPPEYDPYRLYPTILTLHGAGTTPAHQIDWWAGAWTEGTGRSGQAAGHGYIVIAPRWAAQHQKRYGYSARAHAAVLNSLRDACRRFSVDTDRVFLTGHSMGGDAAWDLGLAHPDLWAGVIPIVAVADRYCSRYWENAQYVPFYVIAGELDGDKLTRNATDLDRYLRRGYNCTVVEFQGRGHEHFSDEILRLFDWMGRLQRDFFPREFTCSTMRLWDNFFWWIELEDLPPRSMIDPAVWPPSRGTQVVQVTAKVLNNNGVNVRTGAARATVWLTPRIIDFQQRAMIVVNGRRVNGREPFVEPDLQTLLDDVYARGDRQHPFWAKIEMNTGRVSASR